MTDYSGLGLTFPDLILSELPPAPAGKPVIATIPGYLVYYRNRVYDTVAVNFVRWETLTAPDPTGVVYPGPGVFGVNTSDYCIDLIRQTS